MSFIENLLSAKKFIHKAGLSSAVFLFPIISILLTTCTSSEKSAIAPRTFSITKEEREWLREFFRELLFENPGAYTLYGTKPMAIGLMQPISTEKDTGKWNTYFSTLSEEEKAKYKFVKRKQSNFLANVQKWQEIKARFQIRQYLFGVFPLDENNQTFVFINIEETLRTLLKYYPDFQRTLGFEFDPFQVVFEVEDENSQFWKEVIVNNKKALLGILLGYGQDNAWFFQWDLNYEKDSTLRGNFIRSLPSKFDGDYEIIDRTPFNFPIPIFRSYGLHPDKELIIRYQKEHAFIKKLYQGKDEVDLALTWLTR